jgi:hypothetical protein
MGGLHWHLYLKKCALVLHAGPMNTTASLLLGPPL